MGFVKLAKGLALVVKTQEMDELAETPFAHRQVAEMGCTEVQRMELPSSVRLEPHCELEMEVVLLVDCQRKPNSVNMAEMQRDLVQRPVVPRMEIWMKVVEMVEMVGETERFLVASVTLL